MPGVPNKVLLFLACVDPATVLPWSVGGQAFTSCREDVTRFHEQHPRFGVRRASVGDGLQPRLPVVVVDTVHGGQRTNLVVDVAGVGAG